MQMLFEAKFQYVLPNYIFLIVLKISTCSFLPIVISLYRICDIAFR